MSDLIKTPPPVANEIEISSNDDLELENMALALSPFNSINSELLDDIDIPSLLDPTLPTMTTPPPTKPNDFQKPTPSIQVPTTNPHSPPPTSSVVQTTSTNHIPSNTNITVTIDNDTVQSPTRKYTITEDPAYIESGVIPPILHPLQNPSQLNAVSQDFQQQNPDFRINLTNLYMTPTDYRFTIPAKNRTTDHFIAFASRQHSQLSFWHSKRLRFVHLQFNFLRPTYFESNLDDSNPDLLPFKVRKLHHHTYTKFLKHKAPQNFIFQNHKYTSPLNLQGTYKLDHLASTGTLRNYDPVKQYYIFTPHQYPDRPLIVPQEALISFDDFLLPDNIPNSIKPFFPQLNDIVTGPLSDSERSYYTATLHKLYTYNELAYIISKLVRFLFTKQYKYRDASPQKLCPSLKVQPVLPISKSSPHTIPKTFTFNQTTLNTHSFLQSILSLLTPFASQYPNQDPIQIIKHIFDTHAQINIALQTATLDLQRIDQSTKTLQLSFTHINKLFNNSST